MLVFCCRARYTARPMYQASEVVPSVPTRLVSLTVSGGITISLNSPSSLPALRWIFSSLRKSEHLFTVTTLPMPSLCVHGVGLRPNTGSAHTISRCPLHADSARPAGMGEMRKRSAVKERTVRREDVEPGIGAPHEVPVDAGHAVVDRVQHGPDAVHASDLDLRSTTVSE